MASLFDDLSAGKYQKAARGLLGPAYEPLAALPGLLGEFSVGADIRDYQAYGSEAIQKALRGDYGQAGLDALWSAAALAGTMVPGHASMADPRKLKKKVKKKAKPKKAKRMTDLPDLREIPVDEAIAIARKEPHLIPSGPRAVGKYVAGPRNVERKQDLTKIRRELDASIDAGAEGGDWYNRYRGGVYDVTGGNPEQAKWMSKIEGQFSAGVDPASELGYSIKETSGLLGGTPVKAARPAQHAALLNAAAANDPSILMLGDKTGKYADKVNPAARAMKTATGVNDFRHFRNLGYTDSKGMPVDQVKGTPHIFADYETALAVDRANKRKLAGRSDWTGEQIQATAWVKQKSDDLYRRGKKRYDAQALKQMKADRVNDLSSEAVEEAGRKLAFGEANRTIADFFPKHTAYDTYEMQPGPSTGHLPASVNMNQAQRDALAADPRGSFATAPGGRDAVYAGLHVPTAPGISMRVRPTAPMQGIYKGAQGLELNQGAVARPLVGYTTHGASPKTLATADRDILEAATGLRAGLLAQDAGAAHVITDSGRMSDRNAVTAGLLGKLTPQEALDLRNVGAKYGYGDLVDRGEGITMTNFSGPSTVPSTKDMTALESEARAIRPDLVAAKRMSQDSVYTDLTDEWKAGEGSGEVTKKILGWVEKTPELAAAMDNNPYIAQNALDLIARDKDLAKIWGPGRADLKTFRKIIGAGPGWVGRLKKAVKAGTVPAIAAAAVFQKVSTEFSEDRAS